MKYIYLLLVAIDQQNIFHCGSFWWDCMPTCKICIMLSIFDWRLHNKQWSIHHVWLTYCCCSVTPLATPLACCEANLEWLQI